MRPLLAILLSSLPLAAQTVVRGPSLWEIGPDSVRIAFRSAAPRTPAVEWGTTPSLGQSRGGAPGTDHLIRLTGLQPDRYYYYRLRLDGQPVGPVHRFRTYPRTGEEVSFFVTADCGTGTAPQLRVARALERYSFDFGLLPGDVVYDNGEPQNFDPRFFQPYAPLLATTPFYPVLGNHDIQTAFGLPFLAAFYLPTASSGTERWFSFDHGDIHFIGLDANLATLASQTAWLASDLAAARARGVRWIFVFFHQPAYTSGPHGRDPAVFANWCPLFEQYEVDAVFCGHDHHYERTGIVRDFFANNRGVVYFVVGTGGRTLRSLGNPQPYTASRRLGHGALRVDVRGNLLTTAFIEVDAAGAITERDRWMRTRGPITPGLLALGPDPALGESWTGMLYAPPGSAYWLFLSDRSSPRPVAGIGTWHLGPGIEVLLQSGAVPASSSTTFGVTVPNAPNLVGLDLFYQAGTIRGGTVELTDVLTSRVY